MSELTDIPQTIFSLEQPTLSMFKSNFLQMLSLIYIKPCFLYEQHGQMKYKPLSTLNIKKGMRQK